MTKITQGEKIFFGFVGSFALWVGFWGYLVPSEVGRALPWVVPPLHARFLGSLYASGTVLLVWSIFSEWWEEVKTTALMVAAWTGWMLIVSCIYFFDFNFHKPQTWFWWFAYVVYPLTALWLLWRHRKQTKWEGEKDLPILVRCYLFLQGVLLTVLAIALFFFSENMILVWPWKITLMLIQLYSAPFLAYGLANIQMACQKSWSEIRIPLTANFIFTTLVLIASILHHKLFSLSEIGDQVWFIGFTLSALVLGFITYQAFTVRMKSL